MAWLPGWNYRKLITISATQVDSNLSGFPLTIPISKADVESHYGHTDGDDIRFTASDGNSLLSHEWSGWCDDGYSGAFVKIPAIDASTDTVIYMYYGNESASDATDKASVWADYAVAAHFLGGSSGMLESASGLTLTFGGSATAVSNGVLLDDGYVLLGNSGDVLNALEGEVGCTFSAALHNIYPQNDYQNARLMSDFGSDFTIEWSLLTYLVNTRLRPITSAEYATVYYYTTLSNDSDAHSAIVYRCYDGMNSTRFTQYFNGATAGYDDTTDTATSLHFGVESQTLRLGGYTTAQSLNGAVSEFRVCKGVASAAWVKFEHANLMTPGNQLTLGEEENIVSGPYQIAMLDTFQTDIQQAETYIPGIIAGHTHGT